MNLILSDRSPLHSVFSNESGQAIYKVDTPKKLGTRTATITRVVPNEPKDRENGTENMQDRFTELAKIEFKAVDPSRIRFGNEEYEAKKYLKKEGWGWYGR